MNSEQGTIGRTVGNGRRALAEAVPVGYKQTEAGVIPEDWEARRLGEITDVYNGATPSTQIATYWGGQLPWCIPTDITGTKGKYLATTERYITAKGLASCSASLLPVGALLLCSRATIGEVKIAQVEVCTNQGFKSLVCKHDNSNEFIYYALLILKSKMIERAIGSTFLEIGKHDIKSIFVALPKRTEQRAIAEALSDVDGLLAALEALIAKKQAIKKAAMQQLLTGKTRLPGFSGEWERKRIGDLLYYERPDHYIVRSTEYSDYGNIPVLTANKSFLLGYTDEEFGICTDVPVIIFDDFTTDCKYATFSFKVKSSAIKILRARQDQADLRYVFERIRLICFPLGDHKRYYISEYQNIELFVPDVNEQRVLVSVVSDMDAEIAALEQRRDKARAVKQGMMQQLLTGRVRLI